MSVLVLLYGRSENAEVSACHVVVCIVDTGDALHHGMQREFIESNSLNHACRINAP